MFVLYVKSFSSNTMNHDSLKLLTRVLALYVVRYVIISTNLFVLHVLFQQPYQITVKTLQ